MVWVQVSSLSANNRSNQLLFIDILQPTDDQNSLMRTMGSGVVPHSLLLPIGRTQVVIHLVILGPPTTRQNRSHSWTPGLRMVKTAFVFWKLSRTYTDPSAVFLFSNGDLPRLSSFGDSGFLSCPHVYLVRFLLFVATSGFRNT